MSLMFGSDWPGVPPNQRYDLKSRSVGSTSIQITQPLGFSISFTLMLTLVVLLSSVVDLNWICQTVSDPVRAGARGFDRSGCELHRITLDELEFEAVEGEQNLKFIIFRRHWRGSWQARAAKGDTAGSSRSANPLALP
jgi:hypothetical protein